MRSMRNLKKRVVEKFNGDRKHFGLAKSLLSALDEGVNQFLRVDCLKIRVVGGNLASQQRSDDDPEVSCRFATLEDLLRMQNEGYWEISESKLKNFRAGDRCVLSYVDGRLGGYTWVHVNGQPEFFDNLRIRIPDTYIYGYASFTLPEFRGKNLMLHRRKALLSHLLGDKHGMLAFVKVTNWSSIRGQSKSNFRTIGYMWLVRLKKKYYVWFSKRLRTFGLKRI